MTIIPGMNRREKHSHIQILASRGMEFAQTKDDRPRLITVFFCCCNKFIVLAGYAPATEFEDSRYFFLDRRIALSYHFPSSPIRNIKGRLRYSASCLGIFPFDIKGFPPH